MSIYQFLTTQVYFSWLLLPIIICLLYLLVQFKVVRYMRITVITLAVAFIGGCCAVKYHNQIQEDKTVETTTNNER